MDLMAGRSLVAAEAASELRSEGGLQITGTMEWSGAGEPVGEHRRAATG